MCVCLLHCKSDPSERSFTFPPAVGVRSFLCNSGFPGSKLRSHQHLRIICNFLERLGLPVACSRLVIFPSCQQFLLLVISSGIFPLKPQAASHSHHDRQARRAFPTFSTPPLPPLFRTCCCIPLPGCLLLERGGSLHPGELSLPPANTLTKQHQQLSTSQQTTRHITTISARLYDINIKKNTWISRISKWRRDGQKIYKQRCPWISLPILSTLVLSHLNMMSDRVPSPQHRTLHNWLSFTIHNKYTYRLREFWLAGWGQQPLSGWKGFSHLV